MMPSQTDYDWLADDPREPCGTPTGGLFWALRKVLRGGAAHDFLNMFRNCSLVRRPDIPLDARIAGAEGVLALWVGTSLTAGVLLAASAAESWAVLEFVMWFVWGMTLGESAFWFVRRTQGAVLSRRHSLSAIVAFPTSRWTEWLAALIASIGMLVIQR